MKKCLIAIAMVLALSMNADAAAQKHRHTPRTEQVDSTKNNQDAIEAFSDTTTVADSASQSTVRTGGSSVTITTDEDVKGLWREVIENVDSEMIIGGLIAMGVLFILFVLFPIVLIIGVVYFINRNRKEKLKLAQMAVQNGQPIPEQLLKEEAKETNDDYQSGIRQMFTGAGLAIFLGIVAGDIGFGIGALVFCIGLGKWYIARKSGATGNDAPINHSSDDIINSNIKDYDKETNAL
jgi:hypothetical protein